MSNAVQQGTVGRSGSPVLDFNNELRNDDDTDTGIDKGQKLGDKTESGEQTEKKGTGKERKKRQKIKSKIDELTNENKSLRQKLATLEQTGEMLSTSNQQQANLTLFADKAERLVEKNQLELKLVESEKSRENAQTEIIALKEAMESLKNQVEEVSRSNDNSDESKQTLEAKVQALEKELQAKRIEHKNKNKDFKRAIGKLEKENDEQKESIRNLRDHLNKRENDIKAKKHENEKQKTTYLERQKENEAEKKKKEEKILEMERMRSVDKSEINRLKEYAFVLPTLQKELDAAEQKIQKLLEEKQDLVMRLSRVAGANLVLNNPNIADLSDEKRPTKLAEEFSELYDNQWTDAFETIAIDGDKEKTTYLLNLLKRANEICRKLSIEHAHNIKKGLCSITIHTSGPLKKSNATEIEKDEDVNTQTHMDVDTEQLPDNPVSEINTDKVDDEKANDDEDDNKMADQRNMNAVRCSQPHGNENQPNVDGHTNTAEELKCQTNPDEKSHPNNATASKCPVGYDTLDDIIYVQEDVNKEPHEPVKVMEVEFEFDDLHNEQKKTVLELRKFIQIKLADKLELAAADTIASENGLDPGNNEQVLKYVKQCFNVCWSMCQHDPPVYISFPEVIVNQKYDANIYKPYTKTGKYMDFIVWPAVYLHEGGPLLCKGVAQGKN